MRLLIRASSEQVFLTGPGRIRGTLKAPYEVRANGQRVDLNQTQGLYVLAFFCHPMLSEMDLVEIRWPDPDTMPDQWRNCLKVETCMLNKRLALLDARIVRHQGHYRLLEPRTLEMAA